jgi:large subunit ribosomal protein L3
MSFILGKKIKMAQIFDKEGRVIPVTIIEAGPCKVLGIKNKEKDNYEAIELGFEEIKKRNKLKGHLKKKPFRYIKEFKGDISQYKIGDIIDLSVFKEGDKVKVSGISKGKGFQGAVKRWGFSGRDKTHGVKHEHRTLGSVGSSWPERVIKGRKMPGRTGGKRVTIKNLEIVKIDKEKNLLAIKGAVPGRRGTLLEIRKEK